MNPRSLSWQDNAACAGIPVDVFYPRAQGGNGDAAEAKDICARCPVTVQCLTYALDLESETGALRHGIWGGTTPIERGGIAMSRAMNNAPDLAAQDRRLSETVRRLTLKGWTYDRIATDLGYPNADACRRAVDNARQRTRRAQQRQEGAA